MKHQPIKAGRNRQWVSRALLVDKLVFMGLMWAFIFPWVSLVVWLLQPHVAHWPYLARMALATGIIVPVIVLFIAPTCRRLHGHIVGVGKVR